MINYYKNIINEIIIIITISNNRKVAENLLHATILQFAVAQIFDVASDKVLKWMPGATALEMVSCNGLRNPASGSRADRGSWDTLLVSSTYRGQNPSGKCF